MSLVNYCWVRTSFFFKSSLVLLWFVFEIYVFFECHNFINICMIFLKSGFNYSLNVEKFINLFMPIATHNTIKTTHFEPSFIYSLFSLFAHVLSPFIQCARKIL